MEGLLSERSLGSGAVLLTERDVDIKVLGGRCAEKAAARFTHAAARHVRRMRRLLGVIVVF